MLISSKNRFLHMQITADVIGVYTKVFCLSPYQNFDVIRQWSVQWCLMAGPSYLLGKVLTAKVIATSLLFPLLICCKNNKKNKSSLCSQTYSWNKGGLKLFLFQEY